MLRTCGATSTTAFETRGLDLVAQLNLTGPRDFLLQLEEERGS